MSCSQHTISHPKVPGLGGSPSYAPARRVVRLKGQRSKSSLIDNSRSKPVYLSRPDLCSSSSSPSLSISSRIPLTNLNPTRDSHAEAWVSQSPFDIPSTHQTPSSSPQPSTTHSSVTSAIGDKEEGKVDEFDECSDFFCPDPFLSVPNPNDSVITDLGVPEEYSGPDFFNCLRGIQRSELAPEKLKELIREMKVARERRAERDSSESSFSGTEYTILSEDSLVEDSHSSDLVPVLSPCVKFDFPHTLPLPAFPFPIVTSPDVTALDVLYARIRETLDCILLALERRARARKASLEPVERDVSDDSFSGTEFSAISYVDSSSIEDSDGPTPSEPCIEFAFCPPSPIFHVPATVSANPVSLGTGTYRKPSRFYNPRYDPTHPLFEPRLIEIRRMKEEARAAAAIRIPQPIPTPTEPIRPSTPEQATKRTIRRSPPPPTIPISEPIRPSTPEQATKGIDRSFTPPPTIPTPTYDIPGSYPCEDKPTSSWFTPAAMLGVVAAGVWAFSNLL